MLEFWYLNSSKGVSSRDCIENGYNGTVGDFRSRIHCVDEPICGAALCLYCDRPFARGEPLDE